MTAAELDRLFAAAPDPRTRRVAPGRAAADAFYDGVNNAAGPGSGRRHAEFYHLACLARDGGINPDEAVRAIHGSAPWRTVREVRDTVRKVYAMAEAPKAPEPLWRPLPINGAAILDRALERHPDPLADAWERSPERLHHSPDEDAAYLIDALFDDGDHVFTGPKTCSGKLGVTVRTVREQRRHYARGGAAAPLICVNPLTGEPALTQSGRLSLRCIGAVKVRKHVLIEIDKLPGETAKVSPERQMAFWLDSKLPIVAMTFSGGSSIHVWIRGDVNELRPSLKRVLTPLGADSATWHAAALSRCPGWERTDYTSPPPEDRVQRLLYLDRHGKGLAR